MLYGLKFYILHMYVCMYGGGVPLSCLPHMLLFPIPYISIVVVVVVVVSYILLPYLFIEEDLNLLIQLIGSIYIIHKSGEYTALVICSS